MNFREMNLRIFQGLPVPHVLFQPRFEPWYDWHRIFHNMPARYEGLSLRDMFDTMGVSMRYMHYYSGIPDPVRLEFSPAVTITRHQENGEATIIYDTPYGSLTEGQKFTQDETWRTVEFPVKGPQDFRAFLWLIEQYHYRFDQPSYDEGDAFVGERGIPQFWVPKSPYQALAQTWMNLESLVYAMSDYRPQVEEVMRALDASYDDLYRQICASGHADGSGKVQIINFGENLHEALMNPRSFEQYYLPFYEKRCAQLKAAGIYSHVHVDGYFHHLIKYLSKMPFDGIEALTPLPQGDMTLEEIKENIGDKVLLDGIPAVLFMDDFSRDEVMASAEKVVKLFAPRLILGVSDEVPEGAGEEAMLRMKLVADWCKGTQNGSQID